MRKFIVLSMITLDGVMQGPGGPDEDRSNGFGLGGWVAPYTDEIIEKVVQDELHQPTDFLLGRKTFEIWENYWPHHNEYWPRINDGTKYILSNTRNTSSWNNTLFINNLEEINNIKNSDGPNIQVWGSSDVIQLLLQNDLVDELRLKIYPVTLGEGKKLFDKGKISSAFTLIESFPTPSGVIFCHYKHNGKVKTGTIEI